MKTFNSPDGNWLSQEFDPAPDSHVKIICAHLFASLWHGTSLSRKT
jgi:hypothetical protein